MRTLLAWLLPLALGWSDLGGRPPDEGRPPVRGLVVERPSGPSLHIPDGEVLDYEVVVDIALLGSTGMGSFQLSAGTEAFHQGLNAAEPGPSQSKTGWIRGRAMGSYLNYTLDHVIEARILPQDWPRVIYRDTQSGTENRRRELMYGLRDGKPAAWSRSDRHCKGCDNKEHFLEGTWPFSSDHHCEKCRRPEHRVWRKPETREVPEGCVDMLSAVHLARAMVREGREELEFPLIDRDSWWAVRLERSERKVVTVPAGSFDCVSIKLTPKRANEEDGGRFQGLFGIHGSLAIWLEGATGVPVKIEGVVPAGPLDVDVALKLSRYEGTPADFRPAE